MVGKQGGAVGCITGDAAKGTSGGALESDVPRPLEGAGRGVLEEAPGVDGGFTAARGCAETSWRGPAGDK